MQALDEIGFETPTEIQSKAIPTLLQEDPDIIGLAQTGTGKTAAFGLPLLDKVDPTNFAIQAVVLAPTRELVQQIALELQAFSKYKPHLHLTTVYGGTSISAQIREIKKDNPSVIVATPGRLIDLINRKVVKLHDLEYIVLDEADEMLNMGFQEEIDEILKHTPDNIKTWLFSATMPKSVRRIVSSYMHDPVEITVDRQNITNQNLEHKYVLVHKRNKAEALKRVIDYLPELYAVIFCRTKRDTQELADTLVSDGYRADAIHGDLSQGQRDTVMRKFRSGSINLLIATDVAARGIDVDDLTHVIHYTLPDTAEYYTHRSGRTARAGKKGTSLTILIPQDKGKMRRFSRELSIDFEKAMIPKYAELLDKRLQVWTERLVHSDESDVTAGMIDRMIHHIGDMDRDTLLAKLIARQLRQLKKNASTEDLNLDEQGSKKGRERKGDRRDSKRGRRDRGRSHEKEGRRARNHYEDREQSSSGMKTMFINIGKMDGMNKKDLVEFISKHGKIAKDNIGDIKMNKMNSTFDLSKSEAKEISKKFKNILLGGRDIRCNLK